MRPDPPPSPPQNEGWHLPESLAAAVVRRVWRQRQAWKGWRRNGFWRARFFGVPRTRGGRGARAKSARKRDAVQTEGAAQRPRGRPAGQAPLGVAGAARGRGLHPTNPGPRADPHTARRVTRRGPTAGSMHGPGWGAAQREGLRTVAARTAGARRRVPMETPLTESRSRSQQKPRRRVCWPIT